MSCKSYLTRTYWKYFEIDSVVFFDASNKKPITKIIKSNGFGKKIEKKSEIYI